MDDGENFNDQGLAGNIKLIYLTELISTGAIILFPMKKTGLGQ